MVFIFLLLVSHQFFELSRYTVESDSSVRGGLTDPIHYEH